MVLTAVNSAVINQLQAGWPWWVAAVLLTGAAAWLACWQSAADLPGSGDAAAPSRAPAWWWWPAAMTAGCAAIVWWPWRWRVDWLGFLPAYAVPLMQLILLLGALVVLWLGRRAVGVLLVVVVLAGLVVRPAAATANCGRVMVVVQASLLPRISSALDALRAEGSTACTQALWLVRTDRDVLKQLRGSAAVLGGLITSDPEVVRNLNPDRAGVDPAPATSWFGIGRDVASVFPPSGRTAEQRLSFRAATPPDPVAMKAAMKLGRRLSPSSAGFGTEQDSCPAGVVIPRSWTETPCNHANLVRDAVADRSGTAISVPVLGIPLQPPDGRYGPGKEARAAVASLFRSVQHDPGRADLDPLVGNVAAAVTEVKSLKPLEVSRPVRLIAVLDASSSTGHDSDPGYRGGLPTLEAGMGGLVRTEPRTTVLIAQDAGTRPDPVRWRDGAERRAPAVAARGETGLPTFLARARTLREAAVRAGERPVTVLLTDGVNLFRERPVARDLLRGVVVLVIGNPQDCAAVPRFARAGCRPANGSPADVADELARLTS
ncbi:hypothetical protein Ari01nite_91260 [Paractinoplanes rishiriensis]|uniref:VWFA domain-containing protein n=1 Tax=Paractinoplanes rishiriensis TaxID=1050105 RepID=A0A919MVQ3_9ACTN|nr:hypothetical protein Ari01nite_91260 [Actinoplanes rishiriensis]